MNSELSSGISPDIEAIIGKMPLDQQRKLRGRMGKLLRAARKRKTMQQEEAAQLIGISRPHLSNVEQGRSRPGWEGIQRMAAVYGIEIQELINSAKEAEAAEPTEQTADSGLRRWISDAENKHATLILYLADNLSNYEKSIMRDFHVLSPEDRADEIERIRLKIQRRLQWPDRS